MFYKLLKVWAHLAFRLYFRRMFIFGRERIPKKGPVIFLVNHPSTFLEACIIASNQHRDLHFLVRGDMFEKKWLLPILRSTNQIPIYRFKDGFGKLRNNKSTFDQSFEVLAQQEVVLMFPEASSQLVKYLRPLQKGAARLAIGTIEEKNVDELYVVPTGIYYINPTKSRKDVYLEFGEPIDVVEWYRLNEQADDKLGLLTNLFQEKMQEVVPSISHHHQEGVYNLAFEMIEKQLNPYNGSGVFYHKAPHQQLSKFIAALNSKPTHALTEINDAIHAYVPKNVNFNSFDAAVYFNSAQRIIQFIACFICFLIGLPGIVAFGIPLLLAKSFSKRKIKSLEFYPPVRLAITMVFHFLFSIPIVIWIHSYYNWIETFLLYWFLILSLYVFGLFMDFAAYLKVPFLTKSNKNYKKQRAQIVRSIWNG